MFAFFLLKNDFGVCKNATFPFTIFFSAISSLMFELLYTSYSIFSICINCKSKSGSNFGNKFDMLMPNFRSLLPPNNKTLTNVQDNEENLIIFETISKDSKLLFVKPYFTDIFQMAGLFVLPFISSKTTFRILLKFLYNWKIERKNI